MSQRKKKPSNVKWKLISELIKNSRRSDRELARTIGTSQPTITRVRQRLEREGIVKEYTMIPDFAKLGFSILCITLAKLKESIPEDKVEEKRNEMREVLDKNPIPDILHVYGIGLDSERVVMTLHTDYSSCMRFIETLRSRSLLDIDAVRTFMIDLTDERRHFRTLTLSQVANFLLRNTRNTSRSEQHALTPTQEEQALWKTASVPDA